MGGVWGACVVVVGGMHDRGACMAGGCAWQGGMHGRGACVAGRACMAGGACMGEGHVWEILRDTVNERAVRILLECILVLFFFFWFQVGPIFTLLEFRCRLWLNYIAGHGLGPRLGLRTHSCTWQLGLESESNSVQCEN